jgi:flagella basal body P-ring formation protein FlgA
VTPRVSPSFKRVLRDLAILIGITLAMLIAGLAQAEEMPRSRKTNEVKLAAAAEVASRRVTLADVASLQGEAVERLGSLVVLEIDGGKTEGGIGSDEIRDKLTAAGLSQLTVAMRGYARCRVVLTEGESRKVNPMPAAPQPGEIVTPNLANPTVRDLILDKLVLLTGAAPSDLRVSFDERARETLNLPAKVDRFEIVSDSNTGLGRVPFVITRWSAGRNVETLRVSAEVSRRVKAVVVTGSIARGDTLVAGNFEVRDVYLDKKDEPVSDLRQAIGQTAAAALRPGAVLYPHHLRSATIVRRNELMTVRVVSGGLVIKLSARATADAAINDVIAVRKDNSRETLTARVTGPGEGVMVVGDEQATVAVQSQGDR